MSFGPAAGHGLLPYLASSPTLDPMAPAIPRPTEGDVVDLILTDHRLFEDLLRALRDVTSDRRQVVATLSELLVAHGEAEESKVYPSLRMQQAIDEHEVEHGEKEHAEGYQTLLPLLEAAEVDTEEFSAAIHEFSETLLHHVDEEEREILNLRALASAMPTEPGSGPTGRPSATGCSTRVAVALSRYADW